MITIQFAEDGGCQVYGRLELNKVTITTITTITTTKGKWSVPHCPTQKYPSSSRPWQ